VTVALGLSGTSAALKISGPLAGSLAVTLLAVGAVPVGAAIAPEALAPASAWPAAAEPATAAKLSRPRVLGRSHRELGLTALRRFIGEPRERRADQRPVHRFIGNSRTGLYRLDRLGIGFCVGLVADRRVGREV
jgi:hypothetical protein